MLFPLTVVPAVLVVAVQAATYQLPNLTGPYPVGTVAFELIDYSRIDPLAPTPQPRDIMVSLFYPTSPAVLHSGNYSFAPDFPDKTAAAFDSYLGAPAGTAESIVSRSYLGAPLTNTKLPVLIFGHGFSGSRLIHTAQLEDLASQGWIVVAVDHTYDALIVEFPDGRVVTSPYADTSDAPIGRDGMLEVRVADVKFVVDSLSNSTILSQIPGLSSCDKLRTDRVGIFGASFGGAAAAQAMSNYTIFRCGANFDGSIYGPVAETGLDEPFLLMTAQGHNRTNDPTWEEFWTHLRGFKREFQVNGTVHQSYTDLPTLRDLLGDAFPASQRGLYGTIGGNRLLDIQTAFIDTFFGFCIKGGKPQKLDDLVGKSFPEVSVGY